MTRSNLYVTLSEGKKLKCVADSSSAPEQGYIVEDVILPLLSYNDAEKELALLREHCCMDELRINATYRYIVDLQAKTISFFEEHFNDHTGKFKIGEDITYRYLDYRNTATSIK
jgi:hypothetical protein